MKKSFFTSLLAAILFTSCNNSTPQSMNTDNEKLVRQYFEHFNKHDWKAMAGMYSDTAEFKDPSLGQGIVKQTRIETITKYTELGKIFTDVKDEIINIYPAGDEHIIVEFVSSGTAPDGKKFTLPVCTIFTVKNGLITKDFTYYDNF
jgi:ketosteroid isomerase-like protein